jgi:hypothetical protein
MDPKELKIDTSIMEVYRAVDKKMDQLITSNKEKKEKKQAQAKTSSK